MFREVVEAKFEEVAMPACQAGIGMESGLIPPPLWSQADSNKKKPPAPLVIKVVPPTAVTQSSSAGK
jgi:hypothetical protein